MAPLGWDTGRWMTSFMSAMTISSVLPPSPLGVAPPTSTPFTGDTNSWYKTGVPLVFLFPSLLIILCLAAAYYKTPFSNIPPTPQDPCSWCGQNPLSSFSQLLLAFSTGPSLFFSDTHQHAEHTLPSNPQPPHLPKIQRGQKKPRN